MAEWGNIQLNPTDVPYYGRLSHPVDKIQGQKFASGAAGVSPMGEALRGFGQVIAGAAKVTDELVDIGQTKMANDTFEPMVRGQVNKLEGIRDQMYGARAQSTDTAGASETPSTDGSSTAPPNMDQPMPPRMQAGLDRITQLTDIYNSKRMPDTQYKGEMDKINSDMRSQMPLGLRAQWDHKVAQVTGVPHTANAYMAALNHQISEAVGKANADRAKVESKALSNLDNPEVRQALIMWRHGKLQGGDDTLLEMAGRAEQRKSELELRALEMRVNSASKEESASRAVTAMTRDGETALADNITNVYRQMGVPDDYIRDPVQSQKWIASQGAEMTEKFKTLAASSAVSLQQDLIGRWSRPQKDGSSFVSAAGAEKAQAIVTSLQGWHRAVGDWSKGEASPITAADRMAKMQLDQFTLRALNSTDQNLSQRLATVHMLSKLAGSNAAIFLTGNEFTTLPTAIQNARLYDQWTSITDQSKRVFDDMKGLTQRARAMGIPDPEIKRTLDTYPATAEYLLTNKATPQKEELIDYYYGPQNVGLIAASKQWGSDYYDHLYSPKITQEVKKNLSSKAWDTYKNSAQTAFTNEIAIPLLQKLNTGNMKADNMNITFNDDPESKMPFNYDMGDNKNVVGSRKRGISHSYDSSIIALNRAYTSMKEIAKADGQDPVAYAHDLFKNIGVEGLATQQIIQAIEATTNKPAKAAPK